VQIIVEISLLKNRDNFGLLQTKMSITKLAYSFQEFPRSIYKLFQKLVMSNAESRLNRNVKFAVPKYYVRNQYVSCLKVWER